MECVDELLHGCFIVVRVIAVQLDGKTSALRVVQCHVPVAAYGVPTLILCNVYEVLVSFSHDCLDLVDCAVLAVVVHDDHVELVRIAHLLTQRAADSGLYRPYSVLAGDNHTGLILKLALVHIYIFEHGFQVSAYILQVTRHGFFHLYLHAAVLGVNVVEQFLARLAHIQFYVVVQILVDMLQCTILTDFQSQIVQSCILVIHIHPADSLFQRRGAVQQH